VKTIEQIRAADALSRIEELSSKSDGFKRRYRAYVDRLGPTIVTNGLGQALATERAAAGPTPKKEDEKAHSELYNSLHRWLCRKDAGVYPSAADIIKAIMEHRESLYLRAQAEALAWLEWHKKFCRASFPKSEEE
jgi:CRISPR-associated protein Cmr5